MQRENASSLKKNIQKLLPFDEKRLKMTKNCVFFDQKTTKKVEKVDIFTKTQII